MCCFLSVFAWADDGRTTISLNGEWDFDQTEHAFPPRKYTRKIPVPGKQRRHTNASSVLENPKVRV